MWKEEIGRESGKGDSGRLVETVLRGMGPAPTRTGEVEHMGPTPTDRFSHGESGLHCT